MHSLISVKSILKHTKHILSPGQSTSFFELNPVPQPTIIHTKTIIVFIGLQMGYSLSIILVESSKDVVTISLKSCYRDLNL
jgi:hypothetical protein